LRAEIKGALRELRVELALLNHRVSGRLEMREVDLDCLDLISRHGSLSPGALARLAGMHPATVTGVLDRLERGGWVVRERDVSDRRAVLVRPVPARNAEVLRLYSGMNTALDEICSRYDEAGLGVVADFLARAAEAGRSSTDKLGRG
jgi:DNA-binding MarR family transcriptional regulator